MGFEGERRMILRRSRVCAVLVAFAAVLVVMMLQGNPSWAQVVTDADLSITKDGPEQVEPGQQFDYVLTVSNAAGAATATGVTVRDLLPPGVRFVESDPAICTPALPNAEDRVEVICTVGDLPAGESETITLTVTAPTTPGEITNRASASADNEPGPPVNSNRVVARVTPDLVIDKRDRPDPVTTDGLLLYTLRVENQGETLATGVVVRDELPLDEVDFVRVESDDFDCEERAGIVRCENGALDPGDIGVIRILVQPEEAGTIQNTGAVFVDGLRGPIDTDTEETTVRGSDEEPPGEEPPGEEPPGEEPPGEEPPGEEEPPGTPLPEGDECSPVVRLGTEEPIGVISGTTAGGLTFTNTFNETLPLRVVYATSSEDGSLDITVTPEDGGEAILDETIEGKKRGVLEVDTDSGATYEIEILPEDQGYAILFEIGSGPDECTDPADLDPADASSSNDPKDDVVDEVDNDEDTLVDTGGVPLSGALQLMGTLLLVFGMATMRRLARR